jgi:hypothetical protein
MQKIRSTPGLSLLFAILMDKYATIVAVEEVRKRDESTY